MKSFGVVLTDTLRLIGHKLRVVRHTHRIRILSSLFRASHSFKALSWKFRSSRGSRTEKIRLSPSVSGLNIASTLASTRERAVSSQFLIPWKNGTRSEEHTSELQS